MKLSEPLLLVPAASLVFAATFGPVACSSTGSTTPPEAPEIPSGVVFPPGYVVGGTCKGDVYVAATSAGSYLVCYDGMWLYDTSVPSGYTIDTDAGDDGGG